MKRPRLGGPLGRGCPGRAPDLGAGPAGSCRRRLHYLSQGPLDLLLDHREGARAQRRPARVQGHTAGLQGALSGGVQPKVSPDPGAAGGGGEPAAVVLGTKVWVGSGSLE